MQTLAEQVVTGNASPEQEQEVEEGKIGTGKDKPKPLQGGSDDPERDKESGSEGDGP
jgi:hypothetical protein